MHKGHIEVAMAIPLAASDFSLRYSGSLGPMNAEELNGFLVPCEHRRITSGHIISATYDVGVQAGHARGTLHARYQNLAISLLNKNTGSSRGILDQLKSLYAKIFVLRGNNITEGKIAIKVGTVRYTRKSDDYFLQFLWFALRSAVSDVVGFKVQ